MLKNNNYSILFTGDLGSEGWKEIFERNPKLKCDILKMPHHGAYYKENKNNWGTEHLLEQLQPKAAIISTGENAGYKHPSLETIKALVNKDVRIFCTEYTELCDSNTKACSKVCNGDISIIRSDESYAIKTQSLNSINLCNSVCVQNKKG